MRAAAFTLLAALVFLSACGPQRDMAERVEMPDSMPVMRAMTDSAALDRMLDTMPGGEMARGDSTASMQLLKQKM